jgi:hypothetical protein
MADPLHDLQDIMGTQSKKQIDELLLELEQLTEEIEVKLALASMDARDFWQEKLEPRLFEAREHAKEARLHSQQALEDTKKAFYDFARAL